MKALVIGGNGFIGSHLVDKLTQTGWDVTVLDLYDRRYDPLPPQVRFVRGDLAQSVVVREALIGADVVFYLAWATIHEISNQEPAFDVTANLIPAIHLMEACRLAGVRRLVFTSSGGTVYGPAQTLPIAETHPTNPINGYGVTKLAVEKYLQMFHHLSGLEYAILRPSVPYGPRQNPLGRQGAAAVFLHRVARGLPITLFGDGSVLRDYFYITDLTQALISSATLPLTTERIFNLGGTEEVSLRQLVQAVEVTVGRPAQIQYEPARSFDAPRVVLDTQRARQVLQWQPQVSLSLGLAYTWEWMRQTIA